MDENEKTKDSTKKAAQTAANMYAGPIAGQAVDALSKTKLGDAVLAKGAESLKRNNPQLAKALNKANDTGALDAATAISGSGASGAPSSSGSAPASSGTSPSSSMRLGSGGALASKSKGLFGSSSSDSSSSESDSSLKTTGDKVKKIKKWLPILGPIIGWFLIILICLIVIIGFILGPADTVIQFFRDKWDDLKTLVGYKDDEQWETLYYQKLDEVQEKYNEKFGVCIDVNLITATLTVDMGTDKYVEKGQIEIAGGEEEAELEENKPNYRKMIKQIELLANMQIKRQVYALDENVHRENANSKIENDYCKEESSIYQFPKYSAEDESTAETLGEAGISERAKDFILDKNGRRTVSSIKRFLLNLGEIPVRDSTSGRKIAQNDLKPGIFKFISKKANEERNIEYLFYVPAYSEEKQEDGTIKTVCNIESLPEDETGHDFAVRDIGNLNNMENNVYYWNLMDSFIVEYYADYLPPKGDNEVISTSDPRYQKIKNIIEDIYLLYNEMGESHVCETVFEKLCDYEVGVGKVGEDGETGLNDIQPMSLSNVSVELLECADDTRFNPIPGEDIIPLEKYITGVVYAEIGGTTNYEAKKAQAVAARTYALTGADSIETRDDGSTLIKIRNCTERQVYCDPDKGCWSNHPTAGGTVHSGTDPSKPYNKPPINEVSDIRTAAVDTVGEVLTDADGNLVYTGYNSTTQKQWMASSEDYKAMLMAVYSDADSFYSNCVTVGQSGSGSGSIGYDGEFAGVSDCNGYSRSSPYWNLGNESGYNPFTAYGVQCTWYAYGRALQSICDSTGRDPNDVKKELSSAFFGNAGDWYQSNANSGTYSYSSDLYDIKPGSIVVWNGGQVGVNLQKSNGTFYGHVAFVEDVVYNADGSLNKIVISQAGAGGSGCKTQTFYSWDQFNKGTTNPNHLNTTSRRLTGYVYLYK